MASKAVVKSPEESDVEEKKPVGRPSSYTVEIGNLICELIANGQSLRRICREEDVPDIRSVMRWLVEDEAFRQQYARAREHQAEGFYEELLEIADDDSLDVSGELKMPNAVAVNRARLRVDTRKWAMSKILPKKYGDKIQQEVAGIDGAPIQSEITVKFVNSSNG